MDPIADLRILALETAAELELLARRFPAGEPGRRWLRLTAVRLRNSYARTRAQQKILVLRAIGNGCRTIADMIDELGFSRREVMPMLSDLVEAGYLAEGAVVRGGRPAQWYEPTAKAEDFLARKKS